MTRAPHAALLRAGVCAALALSVVALAACGGGGDDDAVSEIDATALLARAAARMDEPQSFRFALTHEHGSAAILSGLMMSSAKGEVAGKDRLSLTVEAQLGPLNAEVSIIVLPDESWVTNPLTGRWERQDISVAAIFDPAKGITALMRGAQDPKVTGTERIGGVESYVVAASVDSGDLALFAQGAPAGTALPVRAWIGIDDPLVYRVEVDGGITTAEPANLLRRLTLSDFGADIEIKPPR